MTDEKKEPWMNVLAMATVVLAVLATLSNFKGSGFSTRSVLAQAQASDNWAYYQAKSIKGYMYEIQRDKMKLDVKVMESQPGAPAAQAEELRKLIDSYTQKIAKYDDEKAKIQQDAKKLEESRDEARKHSQSFGVALIYFQIAILISSIAAFMKKKIIWYLGLLVSLPGFFYFVNGFLLITK